MFIFIGLRINPDPVCTGALLSAYMVDVYNLSSSSLFLSSSEFHPAIFPAHSYAFATRVWPASEIRIRPRPTTEQCPGNSWQPHSQSYWDVCVISWTLFIVPSLPLQPPAHTVLYHSSFILLCCGISIDYMELCNVFSSSNYRCVCVIYFYTVKFLYISSFLLIEF